MDADFSIELGADDPVLEFPWTDPEQKLFYVDLKRHPEELERISEASLYPEIAGLLRTANSRASIVESAKCDVWTTGELTVEEEIYGATCKFASYTDLVFTNPTERKSLGTHERFARRLVGLLRKTPETPSATEIMIRRCFFGDGGDGFYLTVYVSGYGNDESNARRHWAIALELVANALVQISLGSK